MISDFNLILIYKVSCHSALTILSIFGFSIVSRLEITDLFDEPVVTYANHYPVENYNRLVIELACYIIGQCWLIRRRRT